MKQKRVKYAALLLLLLAAALALMAVADGIQRDWGRVEVTDGVIETQAGNLTYKLYTPLTATAAQRAPGVLLLHGYQNDHETCAAYAIELARRGAVVLALDEYGHGDTSVGLAERGYVNHKVTVNYGQDSEEAGTYVEISGPTRYKLLMNFSNLSFFDDRYSADEEGNRITDSSCGGIAAYAVLAAMDNVDDTRLAVSGHSMGTWSSWSVAAAFSDAVNDRGESIAPKAVVLQCGELFRSSVYQSDAIHFNNVLLLQAKYDEFSYFRDYQNNVDDALLTSGLRTEFLGTDAEHAAWNTTYGDFADGTARRMELLYTNHRLTTHDSQGLAAALRWLKASIGLDLTIESENQVAMLKELLVLGAMLLTLFAMLPLMELLLTLPFFGKAAQPMPSGEHLPGAGKWWKGAVISILIAGLSFPFMTQLGHGLLPLPEAIFRMTIGNGFLSWYCLLILVMLLTNFLSRRSARKQGRLLTLYDMGLSSARKPEKLDFGLYGRSALLALAMAGLVYVVNALCRKLFDLDLRFIWPFFRPFTLERLGQFFVYLPIFALFYLLNNSKIMAMMRTNAAYLPGAKGFFGCWWRNFLVMAGGLLLITLVEYVPFFAGIGPGADLLFSPTFGGPFMSLLILFVPQVLFFSLLGTYCYRRTANAAPGAFTIAVLACWIVTGGSAML
ncbi:MAG: hypothetical protein ACI3XG_10115 [Faecousia sp.]